MTINRMDMESGLVFDNKNSIRVLNGDLKVDSKLENGTKCTISVPLSTEKDYCEDNNYLSENQALKFIRQKNKTRQKEF